MILFDACNTKESSTQNNNIPQLKMESSYSVFIDSDMTYADRWSHQNMNKSLNKKDQY